MMAMIMIIRDNLGLTTFP